MNVFGLARVNDGEIVQRWSAIPGRIDLPGGDVVMGADAGWGNEEYRLIAMTEPDPQSAPARYLVPKYVIVDRLIGAGKLAAARAALDAQSLAIREKWSARSSIYCDDETAIALLDAIDADPAAILAPEE